MKAKALLMNAQFTGKSNAQTLLDERSVRGRWVQIANKQQNQNNNIQSPTGNSKNTLQSGLEMPN